MLDCLFANLTRASNYKVQGDEVRLQIHEFVFFTLRAKSCLFPMNLLLLENKIHRARLDF